MALKTSPASAGRALAVGGDDRRCPGCGVVLASVNGPRHAYFGASPACWALFQRLVGRTSIRPDALRTRRLMRDAYAAQHPGAPQRRAVQSIAVHLMDLCVVLERDGEQRRLEPVLGRTPPRHTLDLHWLEPPDLRGTLTVSDALEPDDADARTERVETWAREVWDAWAEHHATIRRWLDTSAVRPDGPR